MSPLRSPATQILGPRAREELVALDATAPVAAMSGFAVERPPAPRAEVTRSTAAVAATSNHGAWPRRLLFKSCINIFLFSFELFYNIFLLTLMFMTMVVLTSATSHAKHGLQHTSLFSLTPSHATPPLSKSKTNLSSTNASVKWLNSARSGLRRKAARCAWPSKVTIRPRVWPRDWFSMLVFEPSSMERTCVDGGWRERSGAASEGGDSDGGAGGGLMVVMGARRLRAISVRGEGPRAGGSGAHLAHRVKGQEARDHLVDGRVLGESH